MDRRSLSFLFQKLYLPLGSIILLLLFSIVLLQSAQEKERKLSLLVQEVQYVHQSLVDASALVGENSLQVLPIKEAEITGSLGRIEAEIHPVKGINEQVSHEWLAITTGWRKFKGESHGTSAVTASLTKPQKEKLALSLGELQILCLKLSANLEAELQKSHAFAVFAYVLAILLSSGVMLYVCLFVHYYLIRPLALLSRQVEDLASGVEILPPGISNGIFEAVHEKLLQDFSTRKYLVQASEQIGDGNFQQDEAYLQAAGIHGQAILHLRQKMQAYFQAEERRSWSSQGIEQFTKLLREQSKQVDSLCKSLVSEVVPYMNANQGAIFVAEQDAASQETVLQLKASYAWGRHKFINRTISIGEGLIGQAAQEGEMLMITDVPEEYITIGSGLGRAKPRCILILPLIANDVFEGVIELASFRMFEPHELEFLKKLAESIAATLANLKSATKTIDLLEKANAANVHLQAQEEELRQNTEELIATQEAMQKKELELTGLFTSLDYSFFTAEYDLDGLLLAANEKFKVLLGVQEKEGQPLYAFQLLQVPQWTEADYKAFLEKLVTGQPENLECRLSRHSKTWIAASFTPVLDTRGQVYKVMMLASDISEKKNAQLAFIAQAEEISTQEEKLRHYTKELEQLQAGLNNRLEEAHKEMRQQIKEIALEKEKNVAILEGCVDGVVSFNEMGIVEFFNRAAEEIWERPRSAVQGSNIRNLMSIEIQHIKGEPQVFFSKNGSIKMLDIRTEVPLFGPNGEEIEALLTLTRVRVENTFMFTAFVQKVAVELF